MSVPSSASQRADQAYLLAAALNAPQQQLVVQAHLTCAASTPWRPTTPGERETAVSLARLALLTAHPTARDGYHLTALGVLVVGALVVTRQPPRW